LRTVDEENKQNTLDVRQVIFYVINVNHTLSTTLDKIKLAAEAQENIFRPM
jgi:hypothetical protein